MANRFVSSKSCGAGCLAGTLSSPFVSNSDEQFELIEGVAVFLDYSKVLSKDA